MERCGVADYEDLKSNVDIAGAKKRLTNDEEYQTSSVYSLKLYIRRKELSQVGGSLPRVIPKERRFFSFLQTCTLFRILIRSLFIIVESSNISLR